MPSVIFPGLAGGYMRVPTYRCQPRWLVACQPEQTCGIRGLSVKLHGIFHNFERVSAAPGKDQEVTRTGSRCYVSIISTKVAKKWAHTRVGRLAGSNPAQFLYPAQPGLEEERRRQGGHRIIRLHGFLLFHVYSFRI
ncbi:hypothetical protein PoB_007715800 [Plakobranchus ocellatus]|uniref:Uncharacterized protein n=1 Tax=Plakobranchus ocellatus TaxID=259542 RepID=A0AAV4E214_9GAST|nr:hypothetical protein PoB_007715800 [Plakobranchus ocellatus]